MSDTRYKQDGHDVRVRTTEDYAGTKREVYVDGTCVSIARQDGDKTREYTGVNHGVLGPTPSGTFKK